MDLRVECITLSLLQGLCLLNPVSARPYKQKHAVFHSGHSLQNVYFTRDLIQETRTSRVGCASNCHMNARCRSYFYNKHKHRCRTHSAVFTDDSGAIREEGWEYYGHRGRARKRQQKTSNVITTVAPGLDDTPKFAQNATTPSPATNDEDDDDVPDGYDDDEPIHKKTQNSRPHTTGKTLHTTPNLSEATSTAKHETKSTGGRLSTDSPAGGTASDINGGITRMTSHGSRVTIRRTDGKETPTFTPSSKPDLLKTEKSSTVTDTSVTSSNLLRAPTSGKSSREIADAISERGTNNAEVPDSTVGFTIEKESGETDTPYTAVPHDEELHDQLSFLTTSQQNKILELSTGLMVPEVDDVGEDDDDDDDDESVTIVVMMNDDDEEEDHGITSHVVMEETDTTVDVITLGDHTHIGDGNDGGENDDFGLDILTGFPFTTDILGLTLSGESQHDKVKDSQSADDKHRVDPDTKQASQTEKLKMTQHVFPGTPSVRVSTGETEGGSGNSWLGGGVAALGVLGVGVPLLGVGLYAVYRRRRTGSWTILHRQEDGLGLHLISTE